MKEADFKINRAFQRDFTYKHDNPYHQKLEAFSSFVLCDSEGEKNCGQWSHSIFNNTHELVAEIGCGYGEFMLEYCRDFPQKNFIGMDYRFKRSFQLAKKLAEAPYQNFRYLRAKGERLEFLFNENELSELFYFFPDPWPKTRHHKKRLFQEYFLSKVHHTLKNNGIFWIKTDHDNYFEWMLLELQKVPFFKIELQSSNLHRDYPDHLLAHYKTRFEKIFLKKNIPIKALVLRNKK